VTHTAEQAAIKNDAARRLAELKAVRDTLAPDIEDCGEVMSEYTSVVSQIAAAEKALRP